MTWQFVIAGLAVGVLVGMTGMGGGSLMTPMLILLFGFDPKTAVGTDILHGAVFKSFGAWRHRQLGNVHVPLALWMLAGSAPLSLVGVQIASSFSSSTTSSMGKVVGATLILGGVGFLVKTFVTGAQEDRPFHLRRRDKAIAVLIGATFGFVVGLTSVGSGTFFGLAMLLVYPLTARRIVGATLILGGFGFLAKTFVSGQQEDRPFHMGTRDKVIAIAIGATFGFVVGLTSVGSGTFFGLAMLLVYPLTARRIVGTDLLHAAALLWVAGAGHLIHGNVDMHAIAWLLIGSIPGVLIGSNLSIKVPEQALRVAFAFVLVLSGVKLVQLPAATTVIEVGAGFAVLVFAVWSVIGFRNRRVPAADAA